MSKHTHPKELGSGGGESELAITDARGTDISRLLNPGPHKRQSMRGFDDDYVDIVDYIIRCTHKIWEEGGIGLIYTHYRHNVIIHTSDGMTLNRDKVIADSIGVMSAFPNIRLYGDDVIWSGNDEDGFHSSHRITWNGTNTGYSKYGPPTGRRVSRRGIAHCFVKENRVVEEWICRDELALIRQLGLDEIALAKRMAATDAAAGLNPLASLKTSEVERVAGQGIPPIMPPKNSDGFDIEDFLRRSFHEIWNWRLFNKIHEYYAPNHLAFVPSYRQLYGWGDVKAYVLNWLAAFPDLTVLVDHVCWLGDKHTGYRAAVRWTLTGTHLGFSPYGEPTGKRIRIIGISHFDVKDGRYTQEWTCWDEFALLKQLHWPD